MACCVDPLFIGCISHCENLVTGFVAELTGTYTLETDFNGYVQSINKSFTVGQPINYPNPFNEQRLNKFKVYDPTGAALTVTVIDPETEVETVYDCFTVRTQVTKVIDLDPDEPPYSS